MRCVELRRWWRSSTSPRWCSGSSPRRSLATWGPIVLLPEGHYLRSFVGGLTHLIRDEFDETVLRLNEGIAANEENPALNRDMQLIIDQVVEIQRTAPPSDGEDAGSASATSFLLDQFSGRRPS